MADRYHAIEVPADAEGRTWGVVDTARLATGEVVGESHVIARFWNGEVARGAAHEANLVEACRAWRPA